MSQLVGNSLFLPFFFERYLVIPNYDAHFGRLVTLAQFLYSSDDISKDL